MHRYNEGTLSAEEAADFMLGLLRLGSPDELDRWHLDYMAEIVEPGILPAARALVAEHQERGGLCAIVTATNAFVTTPIAQALGFEHLIATIPQRDAQGGYTGRIEGTPSFKAGKVLRVREWLSGPGPATGRLRRILVLQRLHERPAPAGGRDPPGGHQPQPGLAGNRHRPPLARPGPVRRPWRTRNPSQNQAYSPTRPSAGTYQTKP